MVGIDPPSQITQLSITGNNSFLPVPFKCMEIQLLVFKPQQGTFAVRVGEGPKL